MNDPKRRFFSGDSLQQALVQAANHFHLQPEEIAFRPVEKRHGFVKVRRKVVIEVDPDAPKKAPAAPAPPAPPAPNIAPAREVAAAREASLVREASPARETASARESSPAREASPVRPPARPAGTPPARGAMPPAISSEGGVPGEAPGAPESSPFRGAPSGEAAPARGRSPERRAPAGGSPPPAAEDAWEEDEIDPWNRAPAAPAVPAARPGDLGDDDDAQPPGLGQGLVSLPERPRNKSERFPVAVGPQAEAAARGVELLLRVAGLSLDAKVYQGEERLEIDLSGSDTDWCFADDGEMLMSIEHLLPRVIRSLSGEGVLCRVDCDNFHEIREERLRSLAQRVADEVRQKGRARTLVPMNPADRRIIHVTLADNPSVMTESEGEGYFKRITVRPA